MSDWTLRPSLWAAVDVMAKVFGVFGSIALTIAVPALLAGEPVAAGTLFVGVQAFSVYPAIAAAFIPAVQLAFTRYVVDDEGITVRTQILSKSEKRVTWEKVTALHQKRSVIDVLFGIERLDIIAYGERGATLHLVGLRDASPLRDHVSQAMRRSATVEALFRGD